MKLRRLLPPALLLSLVLGACATLPPPGCVRLGPGAVCLLAPAALPAVEASHVVTLTRDGKRETFMGRLAIDAHMLRLAGASLFGTGLFEISYDGHSIQARPPKAKAHADLMLALLEIAIAQPDALRDRLHGLALKTSRRGKTEQRELYAHGHLVARIERDTGPLAQARIRIDIPPANTVLDMLPLDHR